MLGLLFLPSERGLKPMCDENARQLAYAVLMQAVRDYVSNECDRKTILRELRKMGHTGRMVADRLEFHLDEVIKNLGKDKLLEEAV
jgi:hypothetical protein